MRTSTAFVAFGAAVLGGHYGAYATALPDPLHAQLQVARDVETRGAGAISNLQRNPVIYDISERAEPGEVEQPPKEPEQPTQPNQNKPQPNQDPTQDPSNQHGLDPIEIVAIDNQRQQSAEQETQNGGDPNTPHGELKPPGEQKPATAENEDNGKNSDGTNKNNNGEDEEESSSDKNGGLQTPTEKEIANAKPKPFEQATRDLSTVCAKRRRNVSQRRELTLYQRDFVTNAKITFAYLIGFLRVADIALKTIMNNGHFTEGQDNLAFVKGDAAANLERGGGTQGNDKIQMGTFSSNIRLKMEQMWAAINDIRKNSGKVPTVQDASEQFSAAARQEAVEKGPKISTAVYGSKGNKGSVLDQTFQLSGPKTQLVDFMIRAQAEKVSNPKYANFLKGYAAFYLNKVFVAEGITTMDWKTLQTYSEYTTGLDADKWQTIVTEVWEDVSEEYKSQFKIETSPFADDIQSLKKAC